jgi:transcriptional regulator with XRE-family HTH domain
MKIDTKKVKSLRETKQLTQEEISGMLNMNQSTYSRFELGETKLDVERLLKLSAILECDPLDLINWDGKYVKITGSANANINRIVENQYIHTNADLIRNLEEKLTELVDIIKQLKR